MKDATKKIFTKIARLAIVIVFALLPFAMSNILFSIIFKMSILGDLNEVSKSGLLTIIIFCMKELLLYLLFFIAAFNILNKKYLKNALNKKTFSNILLLPIFQIHYYDKEYPKEISELIEKNEFRFDSITARLVSIYSIYMSWFVYVNLILLLPRIIFPGHGTLDTIGAIIIVIILAVISLVPKLIHNNYKKRRAQ